MTPTSIPPLDFLNVSDHFDRTVATHGQTYFRSGQVGPVTWSLDDRALRAEVNGTRPRPFAVLVLMTVIDGSVVGVDFGHCECPAEFNCKHVAAVLFQAKHVASGQAQSRWASALAELAPPRALAAVRRSDTLGLQVNLSTTDHPQIAGLLARPVLRKSQLFSGVLDDGGTFAGALTADDIRALLE